MTEAGWTRNEVTAECIRDTLREQGNVLSPHVVAQCIDDLLKTDSYQQGRVAGLREAAKEVLRQATAIDAANKFNEMAEQLAQAAQDEKDGGIDEASSDERNPRGR